MFITHPSRQARENAPRIACSHGKENTRADNADAPQAIVCGSRAISGATRGGAGPVGRSRPTPIGRRYERFSRHVFRGEMAGLRG